MSTNGFQVIGLLSGFVLGSALLPQIYKTLKTKKTEDISFVWQSMYIAGLSCVLVYAFHGGKWPIYIPVCLEFCCIWTLTLLKLYYEGYIFGGGNTNNKPIQLEDV